MLADGLSANAIFASREANVVLALGVAKIGPVARLVEQGQPELQGNLH